MADWLFKTEPSDYSYSDLERDGQTVWDGVKNNWALKNLRQVRTGDRVAIYHTGRDKAVIGQAKVISDPYPDPVFSDFELVRFSRLSVMPVPPRLWRRLDEMARARNE